MGALFHFSLLTRLRTRVCGFTGPETLQTRVLEIVCANSPDLAGVCTCRQPLTSDLVLDPYDVIFQSLYKGGSFFESLCTDAQNIDQDRCTVFLLR